MAQEDPAQAFMQPPMPPADMMGGPQGGPPQPPMQPGMEPPMEEEAPPAQDEGKLELTRLLTKMNVAEDLDEEKLVKIGIWASEGYDEDKRSRSDWETKCDEWMKLAMQVKEDKNFPWPKASNIKYPLLSTAAMQFAARAYPTLVPSDREVVKLKVIGRDPAGQKAARGKRIATFMSWQILEQMENWEDDMDVMLLEVPIVGMAFKKTYRDEVTKYNCSHKVSAKDLVVNYWAKDLETAERVTQEYYLNKRQLMERIQSGEYLDIRNKDDKLPEPVVEAIKREDKLMGTTAGVADDTTPYLVIEQHTYYDLDDDGYAEPYIITVLHQTNTILRISARWDSDGIIHNEKGKVSRIRPVQYYTKYPFIPNPDGSFYDIGFGLLLGSLNEAVNTLANQLIDSGTVQNLSAGFISKGLKIKQGDMGFKPFEWKQVNATTDDLRKGILPLPANPPSPVLFQLLGMLVQSTKELASVAEIMTGKMPGQNTPAYTTRETVEQGMKVFTAIYKRIYRALTKEFRKLYRLNQLYLTPQEYSDIVDDPMGMKDWQSDPNDIIPAADPQAVSTSSKVEKAKMVMGLVQTRHVNAKEAVHDMLEAMEVPDIERLMQEPPPPPPPPEMQKIQAEMQMAQQEHQLKLQEMQQEIQFKQQELQMKLEFEKAKLELEYQKLEMEKVRFQAEMQMLGVELQGKQMAAQVGMKVAAQKAQLDQQLSQQEHQQTLQQNEQSHTQSQEQGAEQHKAKLQQTKESAAAKPKPKAK